MKAFSFLFTAQLCGLVIEFICKSKLRPSTKDTNEDGVV